MTPHSAAERSGTAVPLSAASSVAPSAAPAQAEGLAGVLASVLEGEGEIHGHRNWFPYGERVVDDAPTLPDGSYGHGGEVLLDGSAVAVLVHPRQGAECGDRAVADGGSNCHAVPGGFVQTREWSQGGDENYHYGAYYSGELAVVVEAPAGSFTDAELSELAQDRAFQQWVDALR